MKTKIIAVLLAANLLMVGFGSVAYAVVGSDATGEMTITSENEQPSEAVNTEDRQQKLQERLEARKQKQAERLSVVEARSISARCAPAQGKIKSLAGRVNGIRTSRTAVYGNLQERLDKLVARLQAENVDTLALEAQITDLKVQTAEFTIAVEQYEQTVTDLGEMDCASDPEAFKASLVIAREELANLKQQTVTIRGMLQETIKPTLLDIKQQIDPENEQANREVKE